ncbi:MAG: hypothetical protein ACI9J0_000741 [Cryomorphaceae bacterium]
MQKHFTVIRFWHRNFAVKKLVVSAIPGGQYRPHGVITIPDTKPIICRHRIGPCLNLDKITSAADSGLSPGKTSLKILPSELTVLALPYIIYLK